MHLFIYFLGYIVWTPDYGNTKPKLTPGSGEQTKSQTSAEKTVLKDGSHWKVRSCFKYDKKIYLYKGICTYHFSTLFLFSETM